jgi:hypothetical protein
MHLVKYRSHTPGLNPRRTKLEVPGWVVSASHQERVDRASLALSAFLSEGGRCGVELFYPYENEFRVSVHNGELRLDGEFGPPPEVHGGEWPPFRTFGDLY